jgi:hypothetical protein
MAMRKKKEHRQWECITCGITWFIENVDQAEAVAREENEGKNNMPPKKRSKPGSSLPPDFVSDVRAKIDEQNTPSENSSD